MSVIEQQRGGTLIYPSTVILGGRGTEKQTEGVGEGTMRDWERMGPDEPHCHHLKIRI